jgi:hypothetical protein
MILTTMTNLNLGGRSCRVKLRKELTPEVRAVGSRKRANRRVNMRTKLVAAQIALERANVLS